MRESAIAAALFLVLTLAYTFPTVLNLTSGTPGLGLNYTLMAHTRFIQEELAALSSPATVERIFYPSGYTIHEGLLPSFMVLILGGWIDPLLGINLTMLASFFLASMGAYLLSRHLSGSHSGALLAGFAFGFCAQHYAHLGTYPIFHLQWVPWFFWAWFRARREPSSARLGLVGLFFVLASLSSWYFTVFLILGAALLGVCDLLWDRFRWRFYLSAAAAVMGASILMLPFTPVLLIGGAGVESGGFAFIVDGSADLLSLFLPPRSHWLMGDRVAEINGSWLGNDSLRANYLGYLPVLLAILGIAGAIRRSKSVGIFLVAGVVIFTILALGPFLVIGGLEGWKPGQPVESISNLRLPFYWLSEMFPFSSTRATSRYSIMSVLLVSVLASFGFAALTSRGRLKAWSPLLVALGLGFIGAELWTAHKPLREPVPVSDFDRRLASEPGGFSVLQLPFQINAYRYPFYSAAHQHRVIGGAVDKPYRNFERTLLHYPFYRQLLLRGTRVESMDRFRDVLLDPWQEMVPGALALFDVRYAVVHKHEEYVLSFGDYFKTNDKAQAIRDRLAPWFELVHEDDLVWAYRRRAAEGPWIYPVFSQDWGEAEQHVDHVNRPLLGDEGTLEIHSSGEGELGLALELTAVYRGDRRIALEWNGEEKPTLELKTRIEKQAWQPLTLSGLPLREGRNVLRFKALEPATSARDVYGRGDDRKIGFLLRRVRLEPDWPSSRP